MHMDMAMATTTPKSTTSSPGAYVAKPPPPPPGYVVHNKAAAYDSYNGRHGGAAATATSRASAARHDYDDRHQQAAAAAGARALDGLLLLLRAAASVMSFVAVALVASCRHGDWMEFARYPEYRCLLGASVLACVYSAAQALRGFRRTRAAGYGGRSGGGLADFAGDQVVAYLLITASSAALPITLRMRSAVLNVFTDAMTAAISLGFIAFAALALSAMLSGFTLSAAAAAAAQP